MIVIGSGSHSLKTTESEPSYGVYSFFKDHKDYILSFLNSIKNADQIILCNAGSNDGTLDLIESYIKENPDVNIRIVPVHICPWRYDDVRNIGLALMSPSIDLCLCLDVEETLVPDWRNILNRYYNPKCTKYLYYAQIDQGNTAEIVQKDRIHRNRGCFWKYPVFEELIFKDTEKTVLIPHVIIKQKENIDRNEIIPLLKRYIKEHPSSWIPLWRLAQAFMEKGRYPEANNALEKALQLDKCNKAQVYTLKAQICAEQNLSEQALFYYDKALSYKDTYEEKGQRNAMSICRDFRIYIEKAQILSSLGRHLEAYLNFVKAKALQEQIKDEKLYFQYLSDLRPLIASEKELAREELGI
ncbi:MAG: tetratricopeptide repeat protein [Clostridiaceae bacterium]|nr:tetratricopeptide repeat protein [Clostridiaceae bacterium]